VSVSIAWGTDEQRPSYEVATVTPSRLVKHDVDLRSRLDDGKVTTDLAGPRMFSRGVEIGEGDARRGQTCMTWYEITNPASESTRTVSVRGGLQGRDLFQVRLGPAQYLVSPAQQLTSGRPSGESDRMNHFKAYRILDDHSVDSKLVFKDSLGPAARQALKITHLCVPAEEWHHDEHFPIRDADACLLVYHLEPCDVETKASIVDQFGLNELKVSSSAYLAVPATILSAAR
jgi:hypothetical protein